MRKMRMIGYVTSFQTNNRCTAAHVWIEYDNDPNDGDWEIRDVDLNTSAIAYTYVGRTTHAISMCKITTANVFVSMMRFEKQHVPCTLI